MSLYKISEQKLEYFRYSKNTAKIYLHYIDEFETSVNKHHSRVVSKDIQDYIDNYKFSSFGQQNQIISALKFMWEKALGKKYLKVNFKRPRKAKALPKVIDHKLFKERLSKIKNIKHRAILTLAFSDGLRVSEVINLRISDIDSNRMIIHIKNAKGAKDRIVPLSEVVLNLLRKYYKEFKPKEFMFEGQSGGKYSPSSCNNIFKKYIDPDGHFHILRHSSFTSMLEHGTDLRIIQSIAGHQSSKTTEIYTHVSNNMLQSAALPI